jgi:hypothetical protein
VGVQGPPCLPTSDGLSFGRHQPAITLNRYSWAIPGNERSAADAMAAMSRGISGGMAPEIAEVVKLPSAL